MNCYPHKYFMDFPIDHLTMDHYPKNMCLEFSSGYIVDLDMEKKDVHAVLPGTCKPFIFHHRFIVLPNFFTHLIHLLSEEPMLYHPCTIMY